MPAALLLLNMPLALCCINIDDRDLEGLLTDIQQK